MQKLETLISKEPFLVFLSNSLKDLKQKLSFKCFFCDVGFTDFRPLTHHIIDKDYIAISGVQTLSFKKFIQILDEIEFILQNCVASD